MLWLPLVFSLGTGKVPHSSIMDRLWLYASTFCFLASFGYTVFAVRAAKPLHSTLNFVAVAAGFVLQTVFLYLRGQQIGRCPLTNLFEVFIFVSWSMTVIYLIIGPAYRLSLLGAFTAPVTFLIQSIALALPIDTPHTFAGPPNAWLEMHASLSIIAYGAFLMAGVAGLMYLVQDRQLKRRTLKSLFYRLPPIHHLTVANHRLIFLGFVLLSLGTASGFFVGRPPDALKVGWSIVVWLLYGLILWGRKGKSLIPQSMARASVAAFIFVLGSLWGITWLSGGGRL